MREAIRLKHLSFIRIYLGTIREATDCTPQLSCGFPDSPTEWIDINFEPIYRLKYGIQNER